MTSSSDTSESPVLALRGLVDQAAKSSAPERGADLEALMKKRGIAQKISTADHEISVNPQTGLITIGVISLEHLWASANFYYVLYNEYANAQRRGEDKFDIGRHERTSKGLDLLNWAMDNWISWPQLKTAVPWPRVLPRPEPAPELRSDGHVANELFRYALGWTLHHEIAHVALDHPTGHSVLSQAEEKAADKWATTWLLESAPDNQQKRVRALGTIIGILALDTFEAVLGDPAPNTHPRAYQRLADCLEYYKAPDDDEAFAFALSGMQCNLHQRGSTATLDGESFRNILDEHLVAMSRATAART